jgi:hypothetical protein
MRVVAGLRDHTRPGDIRFALKFDVAVGAARDFQGLNILTILSSASWMDVVP